MTSANGASRTNPGSEESTIASVTNAALEALRSEVERLRLRLHRVEKYALRSGTDQILLNLATKDYQDAD